MREFDFGDPSDREYVVTKCAATLVAIATNTESAGIIVQVRGVSQRGEAGDWLVSVERIPSDEVIN